VLTFKLLKRRLNGSVVTFAIINLGAKVTHRCEARREIKGNILILKNKISNIFIKKSTNFH
jgi:hypothetical protein